MKKQISSILLVIALFLSACTSASQSPQPELTTLPKPLEITLPSLTGQVISMEGQPIAGAQVTSDTASTVSGEDGRYSLPSEGYPQWVTVRAPGFITRARAASPEQPTLFRLSADDGQTIVLHFAGDTMFGRRFFDPNEDGDLTDGLLPSQPAMEDHLRLLQAIAPLISQADLSVVNLETSITDTPYIAPGNTRQPNIHPGTDYVLTTHPSAIQALKETGIDVVSLSNNHNYDLLESGLETSRAALEANDMSYYGAGFNEHEAWAPLIVKVRGQKIAFIGCTTIWGNQASQGDKALTFVADDSVPKGGAARCEETSMRKAISAARSQADVVVVSIHGGFEYDRSQAPNPKTFSQIAREAGATLVVNHHPHVVSGLDWDGTALTAISMGNFVFDQNLWQTLDSYILAVYIRNGQIVRSYIEPMMIYDYVPHGLTGDLAEYVARGAAGRVEGRFVLESGAAELDVMGLSQPGSEKEAYSSNPAGGSIFPILPNMWVSGYEGNGSLRQGRDLLWVGNFETGLAGEKTEKPLLWDNNPNIKYGAEYAYEGQGGLRLERGSSNLDDSVTTHLRRISVTAGSSLSLAGMARPAPGTIATVQISWYAATTGNSAERTVQVLDLADNGTWQPFRLDVTVPEGMIAASIYVRLSPPVNGTTTLDLDNLALIEWAAPDAAYSPLYTHLLLTGEGIVTYQRNQFP